MNELIVKHEVDALQENGLSVSPAIAEGRIEIQQFPLSPEWTPETTTILFVLPPDYPHTRPELYIPENLKHQDEAVTTRRFWPSNPGTSPWPSAPTGWKRFDDYPLERQWDPNRHGIITLLNYFKQEVHKSTPFSLGPDDEPDPDEEDEEET